MSTTPAFRAGLRMLQLFQICTCISIRASTQWQDNMHMARIGMQHAQHAYANGHSNIGALAVMNHVPSSRLAET